jgi:hypothetical protein
VQYLCDKGDEDDDNADDTLSKPLYPRLIKPVQKCGLEKKPGLRRCAREEADIKSTKELKKLIAQAYRHKKA